MSFWVFFKSPHLSIWSLLKHQHDKKFSTEVILLCSINITRAAGLYTIRTKTWAAKMESYINTSTTTQSQIQKQKHSRQQLKQAKQTGGLFPQTSSHSNSNVSRWDLFLGSRGGPDSKGPQFFLNFTTNSTICAFRMSPNVRTRNVTYFFSKLFFLQFASKMWACRWHDTESWHLLHDLKTLNS